MMSRGLSPGLKNEDMEFSVRAAKHTFQIMKLHSPYPKQDDIKVPSVCHVWSKSFFQKDHLNQHLMIHSGEKLFTCIICQKTFCRKFRFNGCKLYHLKTPVIFHCNKCNEMFLRKHDLL